MSNIIDFNQSVRNYIRGYEGQKKAGFRNKSINNIRKKSNVLEIYPIMEMLLDSPSIYGAEELEGFPACAKSFFAFSRYDAVNLQKECYFQIARINNNKIKICGMIDLIEDLNFKLLNDEHLAALKIIQEIIEQYGFSHFIYRKLAFLNAVSDETAIEELVTDIQNSLGSIAYTTHFYFMHELFETRESFFNIMLRWDNKLKMAMKSSKSRRKWSWELYFSNLWPFCYSTKQLSQRLLTYGRMSLLDVLTCMMTHEQAGHFGDVFKDELEPLNVLDHEIINKWEEVFCEPALSKLHTFLPNIKDIEKNKAYRFSLAFIEYKDISIWRSSIDICFRNRFSSPPMDEATLALFLSVQKYFPKHITLKMITHSAENEIESLSKYKCDSADSFYRTIALLYCLQKNIKLVDQNQGVIRDLLNNTTNLAQVLTFEELEELHRHSSEENQLVISFLAMCMIYDSNPDDDKDFDLRVLFQKTVINLFKSDICLFLDWLHTRTSNISYYVGYLCELPFLERLYILVGSFEAVLYEREKICSWLAIKLNDPNYEIQAKRISTDLKIRKVKGLIDDSRIFIDEVRFSSWLETFLKDELFYLNKGNLNPDRFITLLQNISEANSENEAFEKGYGSDHYFIVIVQEIFEEFCTNKLFGIVSYLSRRIRHGTLEGTLFTQAEHLFHDPRYKRIFASEEFKKAKDEWLGQYKNQIYHMRDNILHFISDSKRKGLFNSNIVSSNERGKILYVFYRSIKRLLDEDAPVHEISPYFLNFCWDALTTDLLAIKKHIHQGLMQNVKQSIKGKFSYSSDKMVQKFRQELDELTSTKLLEVESWFEKPETISSTATLREVSQIVLDENSQYYENFMPTVTYDGAIDTEFTASTYHAVYDVLFVLIGNAAKEGKRDGAIKINCSVLDFGLVGAITITVCSELIQNDEYQKHVDAIHKAMNTPLSPIEMTREGKSGIKKARIILSEEWASTKGIHEPDSYLSYEVSEYDVAFTFILPTLLL